jgi:hypothetical protein
MCATREAREMEARSGASARQDVCPRCRGTSGRTAGDVGLEEYVDRIAEELHERVEHQRRVLKRFLLRENGAPPPAYCPLVDCARLARLTEALQETVAVLEETRSAFKSKKLEVMRKRLIDVLAGR